MQKQNYGPKFVKSLAEKKERKASGLFVVEGTKSILELAESDFEIKQIYCTRDIYEKHKRILENKRSVITYVEAGEIAKMSSLEFNNTGIAVAAQKPNTLFTIEERDIILALDDIRDPGNLGTIIRTAEWYGIRKIFCSPTTAELYNTKVIASSMGSFSRVQVYYGDLEQFLYTSKLPILGALLHGKDVHTFKFPTSGILLVGNEANGINETLMSLIKHKVTIPAYGRAESLNVAMATGIILDNWRRSV